MTLLHLSKLHATGNDFLVRLALDDEAHPLAPATVARLCDRHLGIGADGLITIGPGDEAAGVDCSMRLQNADGGDAEMSGNGIRCLAWVAARAGLGTTHELTVATAAGRRVLTLTRDAGGDGRAELRRELLERRHRVQDGEPRVGLTLVRARRDERTLLVEQPGRPLGVVGA